MGDMDLSRIFTQGTEKWMLIDKDLCGLVDQLRATGYCHTLEVELRFAKIPDDSKKCGFTNLLPEFREKGTVIITNTVHSNRLLHSSARNC